MAYGPRATLASLARQYFDYGRWKRIVVRRHPQSLRLRQALPPLLLPGVLATMHLAWGVGFLFAPAAGEPQTLAGDDG